MYTSVYSLISSQYVVCEWINDPWLKGLLVNPHATPEEMLILVHSVAGTCTLTPQLKSRRLHSTRVSKAPLTQQYLTACTTCTTQLMILITSSEYTSDTWTTLLCGARRGVAGGKSRGGGCSA